MTATEIESGCVVTVSHFGDGNKWGDNERREPGEETKTQSMSFSSNLSLAQQFLAFEFDLIQHEDKRQKAGIFTVISTSAHRAMYMNRKHT